MADRIIKSIALGPIAIELDPAGELVGRQRRNLEKKSMSTPRIRFWYLAALLSVAIAPPCNAGDATDAVFGQIASVTNPASKENAEALITGIRVYFAQVNAKGGIRGRQLKLKLLDDGLQATRMAELTGTLVADPSVLGLLGYLNTPGLQALADQQAFARASIALIAPLQGDRRVVSAENVFPLRTGYADEIEALLKELKRWDKDRISIVNMTSSFAPSVADLAAQRAEQSSIKVLARSIVDAANAASVQAAVSQVRAADPKAILLIASGKPAFDFINAVRNDTGAQIPIYGLSVLLHGELIKAVGLQKARGIVLSQATPYPFIPYQAVVTEYQAAMKTYSPNVPLSFASLEGYLGAKIAAEALRRAGDQPTRAKVLAALRHFGEYDLGGYSVKYMPSSRRGWESVDRTLIDARGGLAR